MEFREKSCQNFSVLASITTKFKMHVWHKLAANLSQYSFKLRSKTFLKKVKNLEFLPNLEKFLRHPFGTIYSILKNLFTWKLVRNSLTRINLFSFNKSRSYHNFQKQFFTNSSIVNNSFLNKKQSVVTNLHMATDVPSNFSILEKWFSITCANILSTSSRLNGLRASKR